jgi:hypothetical protein
MEEEKISERGGRGDRKREGGSKKLDEKLMTFVSHSYRF